MPKVKPISPTMLARSIFNAPEMIYLRAVLSRKVFNFLNLASRIPTPNWMEVVKAIWLLSHLTNACGFVLYLRLINDTWYYVANSGAIATYSISFSRHLSSLAQNNTGKENELPLATILNAENTMLLISAWLHFTSVPSSIKLFPFAIFAYMNLMSYVLHELVLANAFTTALFPVLSCVEPALLGIACLADYLVQLKYYREYFSGQTNLLYGFVFSYICFKRLEKSELSRLSLYNLLDLIHTILTKSKMPNIIVRLSDKFSENIRMLVPIQIQESSTVDVTRRSSVHTRATSIFFEPVSIINDIN